MEVEHVEVIGLERLERIGQRFLGVRDRIGPDFRGQNNFFPSPSERPADPLLGFHVLRRRIDGIDAQVDCQIDDSSEFVDRHVFRNPGRGAPQSHAGHFQPGPSQDAARKLAASCCCLGRLRPRRLPECRGPGDHAGCLHKIATRDSLLFVHSHCRCLLLFRGRLSEDHTNKRPIRHELANILAR